MAMTEVLRRMGRGDITVHGFRSTFRDWAAERTNFPSEVVEMALAHAVGDKVEAAYRRGDLFEKRRQLMTEWASYCNTPAGSGREDCPDAGAFSLTLSAMAGQGRPPPISSAEEWWKMSAPPQTTSPRIFGPPATAARKVCRNLEERLRLATSVNYLASPPSQNHVRSARYGFVLPAQLPQRAT